MRRTWRSWARTSKNSIGIGHRMSSKMDGRRDRRGTLVEKGSKVTRVDVDLVNSTVSLVHVKASYVSSLCGNHACSYLVLKCIRVGVHVSIMECCDIVD